MLRRALKFGFYLVAVFLLLLGVLILTPVLLAQNTNSRYDNILWTSSYVAGQQVLVPIPNAQVQVCSYPANAVPCTNLSTLYYGPTILGGVAPNPTTSDAYGNFGFWAAAGYYQYTITNTQGQSAGPYSISLGGSGAGVNPFSVTPGVVYNTSTSASQNATSAQIVTALNTSPSIQVSAALIPILNQNTTGTAANLSGTPALPNGTTATTQSPGDSTTKLATDAFVLANSPFQSLTTTGSSGAATLTAGVLNIPQYSGGGGSLPTATTIGEVPTAIAAGTTYTAQIPLGGTTWYYPVEWFGAVGDATGATGVGTDDTTAINSCLAAVATAGQGQCLLQAKKYRITAPLTISASSVGISGVSYGAFSTAISNQLAANVPVSGLVIDSATSDAIDAAGGSISAPISFNKFNDFTIIRTVADSGAGTGCATQPSGHAGAAGLSIKFAGGFVVDHVWSEDSACPFYFFNAGAYGTGSVDNSGAMWGANGFNPIVPVYGFFYSGGQSAESFRLRNSFAQTIYPGYSGVQSVGLLISGPQLNDFFIKGFETAFVTYGEYIQNTGSGGTVSNSDIHLIDTVNDTFFNTGIVFSGLVQGSSCAAEVSGGWESTNSAAPTGNGINISGSCGVTVDHVHFLFNGGLGNGISASSSGQIGIHDNYFLINYANAISAINLNGVSGASITGNVISGSAGSTAQTDIKCISCSRSVISGNALSGFANTGISMDSGSSNNVVSGVAAIDPTNISTQVSNLGTNNTFDGVGGLIAKLTGAGTPSSITFSAIPQNYQNLRLVGSFSITSGANLAMTWNGISTSTYVYGLMFANASTPTGTAPSGQAYMVTAGSAGSIAIDFPNYTNTTGGVLSTGTWAQLSGGNLFIGTNAGTNSGITDITSIKLADTSGTALFTAGSVFSLYGLN